MTNSPENKYAEVEKQIDEILSDGKLHLFPPGFGTFLLVNLLMIVGICGLLIAAKDVLFDQMEQAATFMVLGVLVFSIIIVTPPFLVVRGFRKALPFLKRMIIVLSVLTFISGVANLMIGGFYGLYAAVGFICLVIAYMLANSNAYQLLSMFTARRRELALEALERKKEVLSK
ncbi:MAG: hypothetical protein PVJ72_16015 [Gammaproteobacteria bacterium]|jgi:hypothetical protein